MAAKRDRFLELLQTFRIDFFNALMTCMVLSHTDTTASHPALQWLMAIWMFPEMHVEEAANTKKHIEAQGHTPGRTPLACIWCGQTRKGPPNNKSVVRLKINPNAGDDVTANAVYMCAREAALFIVAHQVMQFDTLVESDLRDCLARYPVTVAPDARASWADMYQAIVGPRGKKVAKRLRDQDVVIQQYTCPIRKWPRTIKKGSADQPMVSVIVQWRDTLHTAVRILDELRVRNERHTK